MATRELRQAEWKQYFDEFSRVHGGESATMREVGLDVGNQEDAKDLPFVGISADDKGSGQGTITVMLGDAAADHVEHVIAAPTSVYVMDGNGSSAAVAIDQEDGPKLILELHRVAELTE